MATLRDYFNSDYDEAQTAYADRWLAQTFTASAAYRLTSIKLYLYRVGANFANLTVSIKATDGSGHPTGADLSSGTTDATTLPTTPGEWREITMSAFNIKNAVLYAIVIRLDGGDGTNAVWWQDDFDQGYAGGMMKLSTNAGGSWANLNASANFEVWGDAVPTYDLSLTDALTLVDSNVGGRGYPLSLTDALTLIDSIEGAILYGLNYQQRRMGALLCKLVLTKTGQTTRTYGVDTTNRILHSRHIELMDSHTAEVQVQNANRALTALDLIGYTGILSYGYHTNAGDLYRARPPLKVIAQQLYSAGGILLCSFKLIGIPDQMKLDITSTTYRCPVDDGRTVKTLIGQIAAATHFGFGGDAITVDWDSEDALIDSYTPNKLFSVQPNDNRWDKIGELLSYTGCDRRIEADGHLHIFVPKVAGDTWAANTAYVVNDYVQPSTPNNNFTYKCTTAGTSHASTEPTWPTTLAGTVSDGTVVWTAFTFDYEYNDAIDPTNHTFFNKTLRQRIILPNSVLVEDLTTTYANTATDAVSYALLPKGRHVYANVTSSAQALSIAKQIIKRWRIEQETGNARVPMNVYTELYDWIKITDSREGDFRIGSVGYMERIYQPSLFTLNFGFGKTPPSGGAFGQAPGEQQTVTYAALAEIMKDVEKTFLDIVDALNKLEWATTNGALYPRELWASNYLVVPVGADKFIGTTAGFVWVEGETLKYKDSTGIEKTLTGV